MELVTTTMVVTGPMGMAATIRTIQATATATTIGGAEFPGPTKVRQQIQS